MKPDVSAVRRELRTTLVDDIDALIKFERIAYAITVVEGMACSRAPLRSCIDRTWAGVLKLCDRCTTLAHLREMMTA